MAPQVDLTVTVIEATSPSNPVIRTYPRLVLAQVVGTPSADLDWVHLTDTDGNDPVYSFGSMVTFAKDQADSFFRLNELSDELDDVTTRAMVEGPLMHEGMSVVPGTSGNAVCWGQLNVDGQLVALLAEFETLGG